MLSTSENVKKRYVGIDLAKLIAMLLICVLHSYPFPDAPRDTLSLGANIIVIIVAPFGTIGNLLFIIASSYFLVDKTKTRGEKAINLLLDSMLISIAILAVFLLNKVPLESETIKKQFLPDLYALNWFVPCYVIFYLLAPIVVAGLKKLSFKSHLSLCIFATIVYGLLSIKEGLKPEGSLLLAFFYVLNFVAFFKWHFAELRCNAKGVNKRWILLFAIGGLLLFYGVSAVLYFFSDVALFKNVSFGTIYSPFILFPLIAVFYLFKTIDVKNGFIAKPISYLSSCTLFIYVIHENFLIRRYARGKFFALLSENMSESFVPYFGIVFGILVFAISLILSVIYKETLHRLTAKISLKLRKIIDYAIDKIMKKFFKSN